MAVGIGDMAGILTGGGGLLHCHTTGAPGATPITRDTIIPITADIITLITGDTTHIMVDIILTRPVAAGVPTIITDSLARDCNVNGPSGVHPARLVFSLWVSRSQFSA